MKTKFTASRWDEGSFGDLTSTSALDVGVEAVGGSKGQAAVGAVDSVVVPAGQPAGSGFDPKVSS